MSDLPPPPSPASPAPSGDSWFGALFDTSFERYVTPRLIKVLFFIGVAMATIYALVIFFALARQGGGGAVLGLVMAPLLWLLMVLVTRVMCELYLVLFRIERNTRPTAERGGSDVSPTSFG